MLQDAFVRFDSDGDGLLSREELTHGLKSLRLGFGAAELSELMRLVTHISY